MKHIMSWLFPSQDAFSFGWLQGIEEKMHRIFPQGFTSGQSILYWGFLGLIVIGSNAMMVSTSQYMYDYRNQSQVPISFNFLPGGVFLLGLVLWGILLYLGKSLEEKARWIVYIVGPSFLWIYVEVNLLMGTLFSGIIGIIGVIFLYFSLLVMTWFLVDARNREAHLEASGQLALRKRLLSWWQEHQKRLGPGLVFLLVIYFFYQSSFPLEVRMMGGLFIWLLANIGILLLAVYSILPYIGQKLSRLKK